MKYNLAIIGGGPAGLMAACRASETGASVIILEKNKRPGIKLLATGGGRCNFTNINREPKLLAACYAPNGHFLISAFTRFGPRETIDFFEKNSVATKIENNGRVFPTSDRALDILTALTEKIKKSGALIRTETTTKDISASSGKIEKLLLDNGEEIIADNYLITTGGKSYPLTGSDGAAYAWLEKLGHTVIKPRPALTPLYSTEKFIKDLEGLSLSDIAVSLFKNQKKINTTRGDLIFTGAGLSGPAIFDTSRFIDWDQKNNFSLDLDYFPDKTEQKLIEELQKIFHSGHKLFKNILDKLVAPKLTPVLMALLEISPTQPANTITREKKIKLAMFLKKFPVALSGRGDFDQAMTTAGGVDVKEIDPKTMRSKLISNLYLAGEILDLVGPTGGYSLQLCWSTGYIAGESVAQSQVDKKKI